MRKAILILLLIATGSSNAASEWNWVEIGKRSDNKGNILTLYADLSAITIENSKRKAWTLSEFSKQQGSIKQQEEYDCNQKTLKHHFEYECGKTKGRIIGQTTHSELMGLGNIVTAKLSNIEKTEWMESDKPPSIICDSP